MGNLSDGSSITIQLDSETVCVGNSLKGNVHCELHTAISTGTLNIELIGAESCEWREKQSDGKQVLHKGSKQIAQYSTPVCAVDGEEYAPGYHSFPFTFQVPANYAGSFSMKQPPCTQADISYYVIALLQCDDRQVKSEAEFVTITSRPEVVKSIEERMYATMFTWGCFSQGQVQLVVHIDKNAYQPGETIKILIEIDNSKSSLNIESVSVTLSRRIRLRSNRSSSMITSDTIHSHTYSRCVAAGQIASSMLLKMPVKRTFPGILKAPTVKCTHIECIYFLSISANMGGCCMCFGGHPEVVKELVIYSGEMREVRQRSSMKRGETEPSAPSVE
jgi:hypothetical protein